MIASKFVYLEIFKDVVFIDLELYALHALKATAILLVLAKNVELQDVGFVALMKQFVSSANQGSHSPQLLLVYVILLAMCSTANNALQGMVVLVQLVLMAIASLHQTPVKSVLLKDAKLVPLQLVFAQDFV